MSQETDKENNNKENQASIKDQPSEIDVESSSKQTNNKEQSEKIIKTQEIKETKELGDILGVKDIIEKLTKGTQFYTENQQEINLPNKNQEKIDEQLASKTNQKNEGRGH